MDDRSTPSDTKKGLPGLHPGLNDLIRVLGKQAHCASRTLIVCEPVCPKTSYSESKYHKNCASPKKGRSWDSLCRPSSLWSPIRPETYYYDCFFYRQYPDRDAEYQEIEGKYNAMKQDKLDYSPPECDEEQIKAIVSGKSLNKSRGVKTYKGLIRNDGTSKSSAGKGVRSMMRSGVPDDRYGPGQFKGEDYLKESSMGSARNQKYPPGSGSKRNIVSEGDSVPCAELAEIRDLLKKSDRETIRRMQEMLTLMRELSVRDICRAKCDGSLGGQFQAGPKSPKTEDEFYASHDYKNRFGQEVGSTKNMKDISNSELLDSKQFDQHRSGTLKQGSKSQGLKKSYQQKDGDLGSVRSMKGFEPVDEDHRSLRLEGSSRQKDGEYGPQGSTKIYQNRNDDYKPQGSLRSFKQMDDDYESLKSNRSYQQRDNDYKPTASLRSYKGSDDYESQGSRRNYQQKDDLGPQGSNKSHQPIGGSQSSRLVSDSIRKEQENDDIGHQESEASYQKGNKKKEANDGKQDYIKSGDNRLIDVDVDVEDDDYENSVSNGKRAGSYDVSNIGKPHSLQRHEVTNRLRGKQSGDDDDNQSLSSTTIESERSSGSKKGNLTSRGKAGDRNAASESDLTASSSTYSESSATDASCNYQNDESDSQSTDVEREFEAPKTTSRSLRRHQDDGSSSSETSISQQGSSSSLSRTQSEDRFKTATNQRYQFPKQATLPGSANAGAPDPLGSGANYKIPVGKKNVPMTVHEVVELSNKITDVIVLEVIDELIKRGLYHPPSSRYSQERATLPSTSLKGNTKRASLQKVKEQRTDMKGSSVCKEMTRDSQLKQTESPSRLSRIDESSSRAGLGKTSSRKLDGSNQDVKVEEKRRPEESRGANCPRHSRSLSPSTSSRRGPSSCRLEMERRARSEGDHYSDSTRPQGDARPPKPWERRLSSQIKADFMREPSGVHPQNQPEVSGSRGASMSSQISKTGSHKPATTKVPFKDATTDGSLPGKQPFLPGRKPNQNDECQRTTKGKEIPPQDDAIISGSPGASLNSRFSKTGSYRAPPSLIAQPGSKLRSSRNKRQREDESLNNPTISRSRGSSIGGQTSKQSDKNNPPLSSEKAFSQLGTKESLPSRTRMGDPRGSGNVPSGHHESLKPHGILKDASPPPELEDVHGSGFVPIVCQIPKDGLHEDAYGADNVPYGQRTPIADQDKTTSSLQIKDNISIQPNLMGEGARSRLATTAIPENIHAYVRPGSQSIGSPATSQRSAITSEPCEPDDFIATNYDTDSSVLYYARITNNAFPPVKETFHSAGFMLRSAYVYEIPPRSNVTVKTDLLLQLPRNSYGRIAPRKCLVENYGIDVVADVIDRDYKGNITVVLFNHGDRTFTVERGNKIAQLICESIHLAKVVENNKLLK